MCSRSIHYSEISFSEGLTGRPLVRENDADDHAPRYYGVELQATSGMHATFKRLLAKPAYSSPHLRASCRDRKKLRQTLRRELADRGWRIQSGL